MNVTAWEPSTLYIPRILSSLSVGIKFCVWVVLNKNHVGWHKPRPIYGDLCYT